jgi:hypothetical protein
MRLAITHSAASHVSGMTRDCACRKTTHRFAAESGSKKRQHDQQKGEKSVVKNLRCNAAKFVDDL